MERECGDAGKQRERDGSDARFEGKERARRRRRGGEEREGRAPERRSWVAWLIFLGGRGGRRLSLDREGSKE
jgi:hypothetical protein